MSVIRLAQVSKIYRSRRGEVRALDGVDLSVERGEFIAVRGPSGSGKSTLLLTLGGMVRPTAGQVSVSNTELYGMSGGARARFRAEHVGFIFQMFHLIPYLSVLENVLLPTRLAAVKQDRSRAAELLERFGMSGRLHHRPGELSTGERQRTAIARALVNQPKLVLADEPTGNLDPDTGAEILAYLTEFHRGGGTVLIVTHESWVEQYAGRTLILRQGKLGNRAARQETANV
jgi:putative ABC transport system ATP-binding protein